MTKPVCEQSKAAKRWKENDKPTPFGDDFLGSDTSKSQAEILHFSLSETS